jgi:hypothetical protein
MTADARFSLVMALWCGIVVATGCDREAGQVESNAGGRANSQSTAAAAKAPTGYRNACDLLTIEEVSAAAGMPVTAREISDADGTDQEANESNRLADRSGCSWEGPNRCEQPGWRCPEAELLVKAHWVDGRRWWEVNAAARGAAKSMIQNQEGVALDSVVKSGPVSGLGDKAVFSGLLGSLVLKDDILLEISMLRFPKPEAQFRPLVTKMLSRL